MTDPETNKENQKQVTFRKTLAFSVEFGFVIVLPLIIFGYGGNLLAEHYNNRIFLYAGLILALLTSIIWLYKRINDIYKAFIN